MFLVSVTQYCPKRFLLLWKHLKSFLHSTRQIQNCEQDHINYSNMVVSEIRRSDKNPNIWSVFGPTTTKVVQLDLLYALVKKESKSTNGRQQGGRGLQRPGVGGVVDDDEDHQMQILHSAEEQFCIMQKSFTDIAVVWPPFFFLFGS